MQALNALAAAEPVAVGSDRRLVQWWPLAALIVLAAALRLATLDQQSFWYDEAFTPVHVLHSGLGATLRAVVHHENTPPLWYLLAWADARLFGDGALALRLPSALAGILTVPVVWAIARRLAGRRAAVIAAAIVAVNPLFLWYSQEARAYGLFVLTSTLAMLCLVRAMDEPSARRMAAFALTGALALLTHYFAVFLLVPMALWLLCDAAHRRMALAAAGALAAVGLALAPLISAQGGQGTQWIGHWALSSRLQAIPQYFLTGYSGAPLGRGVELLVALPILAGVALGAWRLFGGARAGFRAGATQVSGAEPDASAQAARPDFVKLRRAVWISLSIAGFALLCPIALALVGADYLAPRNLVAAMIPLSVAIAVLLAAVDTDGGAGAGEKHHAGDPASWLLRPGLALAAIVVVAFAVLSADVDLSPRLQRGNWRDVAKALGAGSPARAITTVELGAAPLEYYLGSLHNLARRSSVRVSEIDETGYAPLRHGAGRPPAPGFRLLARHDVDGLIVYRFVSSVPRLVSEAELRRHVITLAHPEVLVPTRDQSSQTAARAGSLHSQMSSSDENI
ncbi:MAG TPA: glycosyltransferase family 39 protein [Solirubrobacteraceae bacterium]|nr:glycosyltransferase family 39 protein [Solirubrobacteraceae bacterium]